MNILNKSESTRALKTKAMNNTFFQKTKLAIVGLVLASSFLFNSNVNAQQVPLYASYTVQPFLLSPSMAGSGNESFRMFAINRLQFAGIEGAPVTFMLTGDAPFKKQSMGLGGSIYSDKAGLLARTGFNLGYSYKVSLSEDFKLSFGLGADMSQYGIDFDNVVAKDMDEDILQFASSNKMVFTGNFGVHLNYKDFVLGFAAPQLFGSRIIYKNYTTTSELELELVPHYMGFMSYKIPVKEDVFDLQPSVVLRTTANVDPQIDVNLMGIIKDNVFVTAGYRSGYAITLGGGLNITDNLMFGYTYDWSINEFAGYSWGSHEVILGYRNWGANSGKFEKLLDEREKKQNQKLDSLYGGKIDKLENKVGELENMNRLQQKEIDELKEVVESYGVEIDSMKQYNAKLVNDAINNGNYNNGGQGTGNQNNVNGSGGVGNGRGNGSGTGNGRGNSGSNNGTVGGNGNASGNNGTGYTNSQNNLSGKYLIVIASFKEMELAQQHQQNLKRLGETEATYISRSASGTWYYVYKQAYNNPQQAQSVLNNISTDGLEEFMHPWIYVRD